MFTHWRHCLLVTSTHTSHQPWFVFSHVTCRLHLPTGPLPHGSHHRPLSSPMGPLAGGLHFPTGCVTHGICPWVILCVGSLWLLLPLGATHPWMPSPMGAITAGPAPARSLGRYRGDRGHGLAVGTWWWQWEGRGQMCLLSSCSSVSAFPHSWLSIPHPRGCFTLKAKLLKPFQDALAVHGALLLCAVSVFFHQAL